MRSSTGRRIATYFVGKLGQTSFEVIKWGMLFRQIMNTAVRVLALRDLATTFRQTKGTDAEDVGLGTKMTSTAERPI